MDTKTSGSNLPDFLFFNPLEENAFDVEGGVTRLNYVTSLLAQKELASLLKLTPKRRAAKINKLKEIAIEILRK